MMRDFNECKAEIFRRMDNGIKERKRKRNRILAYCVPLCLCLVIFSVTMFLEMLSIGTDNAEAEGTIDEGNTNLDCVYARVEIQNNKQFPEHYEDIRDENKIISIHTLITDLFRNNIGTDTTDKEATEDCFDGNTTENTANSEKWDYNYSIIFTAGDGTVYVYELRGEMLIDVNTNTEIDLSAEQLGELRVTLGLTE